MSFVSKLENGSKLVLFLGSSIGNFNPFEIENFLKMVRKSLNKDDYILIGFDLVKDRAVLEAAYNDAQGMTREFNFNLLRRINRELDGNFDNRKFRHHALFNEDHSRIEMHLVSREAQTVLIKSLNLEIKFKAEETIHTENSHKFTKKMIHHYGQQAKLTLVNTWTDPKDYFALCLFKPDCS
jgi:dimethylhistidine N-methyltransferase